MTNPIVKPGDRIVLYHMEDETQITPGSKGTVISIDRDPFEEDGKIIKVKWDMGGELPILSNVDVYKLDKKDIREGSETGDPKVDFRRNNPEVFENFDWRFFREYLDTMRDTGITNMFGSAPLLYAGESHIERYFGQGKEDNEDFQKLLGMADDAKYKMIAGTMEYLRKKNRPIEVESVNREIGRLAVKMLQLWMTFHS